MGVLGRGEESGPGARLPPLPRGSGVAQRLRSIRCAPRLRPWRLLGATALPSPQDDTLLHVMKTGH